MGYGSRVRLELVLGPDGLPRSVEARSRSSRDAGVAVDRAPSPNPPPAQPTGSILLDATVQAWFRRAQAQFREGLVHDVPTRWNLRFNYEFVKMAIEQAGKDQEKEPIKIMRPQDPLRQPARKIEG